MTTTKKILLAAAVSTMFGAAAPAWAITSTFTFDPTGTVGATGDIANVGVIDQAPGSALAVGGVTAVTNFISGSGSTDFTLLYQANLSVLQDTNGATLYTNGADGNYFTFVVGFGETVLTATGVPGTATFGFDSSSPTNFFKMYATNALGNNLLGTGFTSGTVVLEGEVSSVQSSGFNLASAAPVTFDQSPNGNQWGTPVNPQETVTGSGTTDLTIKITSFDSNYFPSFSATDIIFSFLNTSQVDPFRQVDPSQKFSTDGIANGDYVVTSDGGLTSTLGDVNGEDGPDFQFQADANQSIAVPEPASLALMGLGLMGLGFVSRRRRT